jgi:hypothetical protein
MIEDLARMDAAHRGIPIERHLELLYRDVRVAGMPLLALVRECMVGTGTTTGSWKVFRRVLRAWHLARYFEHALSLPGAWAECGVFRGFSALLLARIARAAGRSSDGAGLHLIDSFEGLSAPGPADGVIEATTQDGRRVLLPSHEKGHFATAESHVRAALADHPAVSIHAGWVPQVLDGLPALPWAFVHIDVDLYQPTLDALSYFHPRMAPGGIIVNDDYRSPLFPGAGRAWDEYCDRHGLPFVILDSGQAILTAPGQTQNSGS